MRQTSATMYPAVNEKDVLNVSIIVPSVKVQEGIEKIIKEAFQLGINANKEYNKATTLLETKLGFENERHKTFMQWNNEIDYVKRLDVGYWSNSTPQNTGRKLSEVASVNTGKQYTAYEDVVDGVEFISIKDFENLFVNEADRFVMKGDIVDKTKIVKGDILLAITGATIGKVGIFNRNEAVVSADVAIIRTETINPYFIGALIQSKYGKSLIDRYTYGATNKHLDLKGFSQSFIIPKIDEKINIKIGELLEKSMKHKEESKLKLENAKHIIEKLINK